MVVTFLSWAFEGELGNPDPWSWLPWALAFDTFPIIEGILGIIVGWQILRRSRTAVPTSFIAAAIAMVSIIPGYFFWQGTNADSSLFLVVVVIAPAILIGTVYTGIGEFARRDRIV